jgi:type II secretory pathway pseudopilin PulG
MRGQRGIALLVVLALLTLLVGAVMFGFAGDLAQNRKQQQTTDALAKAKEALIGFAAGVNLNPSPSCAGAPNCVRPGDLPCPDSDNDGVAEGSCGNAVGTTGQTARLDRLPWKTLGLEDLRDGDGERLWYAVSNNFKYNVRTICATHGDPGCLNSGSPGTITVRGNDGAIIYDGATVSGAIAVVIAPGAVLQRQGSASPQDRSPAGVNDPANYLDIGNGEDNKDFVDSSNTNGFINGLVYDASRNVIVNDRVLSVTYTDLMPILEHRVAKEVRNCLTGYAAGSHGRYPWAARIDDSAAGDFSSKQGYRFGRIPEQFDDTLLGQIPAGGPLAGVVSFVCGLTPAVCMSNSWPSPAATPACNIPVGSWWVNWKEQVFYGVAAAYAPAVIVQLVPPALTVPPPGGCGIPGNCMTVNPPSATEDKQVVVIVAGKQLASVAGGQPRGTTAQKSDPANYLEGANATNVPNAPSNFTFTQQPGGASFNDYLLFQ